MTSTRELEDLAVNWLPIFGIRSPMCGWSGRVAKNKSNCSLKSSFDDLLMSLKYLWRQLNYFGGETPSSVRRRGARTPIGVIFHHVEHFLSVRKFNIINFPMNNIFVTSKGLMVFNGTIILRTTTVVLKEYSDTTVVVLRIIVLFNSIQFIRFYNLIKCHLYK